MAYVDLLNAKSDCGAEIHFAPQSLLHLSLIHILNGSEVESQLRKIVSSGARMDGLLNISFDEYSTVTVLLPDIKEQEHIADFFRNLDHLITLHQRELEKLQNIKKSMLEKMFV